MPSVTAIVVARGGSIRLPNKALLPFAGSTLVGHKVRTLLNAKLVDRVVVGSDSEDILEAGWRAGAMVVQRDDYHCDESRCSAGEMIADMASRVEGDVILWAHPTNPLIKSSTYDAAIEAFRDGLTHGFDSLLSVTRIKRHAWIDGKPFNYDPWTPPHTVAAKLKAIAFQDGAIFIQPRLQMIANSYFFGTNPLLYPVDAIEGWDIDTRDDYTAAVRLSQ